MRLIVIKYLGECPDDHRTCVTSSILNDVINVVKGKSYIIATAIIHRKTYQMQQFSV